MVSRARATSEKGFMNRTNESNGAQAANPKLTYSLGLAVAMLGFGFHDLSSAATLKADYRFDGTLASSVTGAPSLVQAGSGTTFFDTDNINGTSAPVWRWPAATGLRLDT